MAVFYFTATSISAKLWPEGEYGILSHEKCPTGWYEFTHCQDTEDSGNKDNVANFTLGLGNNCGASSFTMRYCFKGTEIPSRKGGFWTKNGIYGNAFVIKNTYGRCNVFGHDGGRVDITNERSRNMNKYGNNGLNGYCYDSYHPRNFNLYYDKDITHLEFCKIGEPNVVAATDFIEVGEFNNQAFGIFNFPHHRCPILISPYGILNGTVEYFYLDDEDTKNHDKSSGGAPVLLHRTDSIWSVCQYDPRFNSKYSRATQGDKRNDDMFV